VTMLFNVTPALHAVANRPTNEWYV